MPAHFVVNIDVPDLEAAKAFYCQALGLSLGRSFAGFAELIGGPTAIYLLQKAPGTPVTPGQNGVRTYHRHWTPVHLDFVTEDIEVALKRAVDAGARLERPVRSQAWGKIALLADPFGNGFCLIEFRGRGYDEIAEPAG